MRIETRRFGPVELDDDQTLRFPGGIAPFAAQSYAIITRPSEQPFAWLQAVDEPELCFVVAPFEAIAEARGIPLTPGEWRAMGVEVLGRPLVLCLVTVVNPPEQSTVNLLAPLVIDTETRIGRQALLAGDLGLLRAPLRLLACAA